MNFRIIFSFSIFASVFTSAFAQTKCETGEITDLPTIQKWLAEVNENVTQLNHDSQSAEYNWATDITPEHEKQKLAQDIVTAANFQQLWKIAPCMNCKAAKCSPEEARRVASYFNIGTSALSPTLLDDYSVVQTAMANIYSTAKVCRKVWWSGKCLPLDPALSDVMSKSKNYCELQWAWEGWRNETGRKMRGFFTSYVLLLNEAARRNGFNNAKEMWTKPFWSDEKDFFNQFEKAWQDVLPLYQELHAYARGKLMDEWGKNNFPESNHIPAHLFGNMWAQEWSSLYPLLVPYPDAPKVDLTALLVKKGWDEMKIFKEADLFFQSIGLAPMTTDFWSKSVFLRKKPPTEMVCHASAWNFYKQTDFRIKMCATVSQTSFQTAHHEMGHIQYYMQYKDLPVEFKNGANGGFHEAIGDLIALSAMTPTHLKAVGILPADFKEDERTSLNALMMMALEKVAFMPFGYLMDKYRWSIFTHDTSFSNLNKAWWDLRCEMQGVSPPVPRTEEDFDAGAKYHIPASTPYDRYFFAVIAQFQFHRGICQKIGYTDNFHKCDIYNNTNATEAFRTALAMGSSVPYPQVLELLTGTTKLDSSAILDYFAPLYKWLKEQNQKKGYKIGWSTKCSPITRNTCDYWDYSTASSLSKSKSTSFLMAIVSFCLVKLLW